MSRLERNALQQLLQPFSTLSSWRETPVTSNEARSRRIRTGNPGRPVPTRHPVDGIQGRSPVDQLACGTQIIDQLLSRSIPGLLVGGSEDHRRMCRGQYMRSQARVVEDFSPMARQPERRAEQGL